ncbi:uncharacterized protein DS421_7g209140 [Arachis hypogaea]|nr:uncharacterized protein DS421_7g209140 [Arachis hypogaea]
MTFAVKQALRLIATSRSKMKGKKDRPQFAHYGYLSHTEKSAINCMTTHPVTYRTGILAKSLR